jgi:maltose alpha-D-glucosyltransferase/alpha-amylase
VGRFLTDTVSFPNTPPLLGAVELEEKGTRGAVAVVHGFIENQGDAWAVTSAYLDRFVEERRLLTAEAAEHSDEEAAYVRRMDQVGRCVAELQRIR